MESTEHQKKQLIFGTPGDYEPMAYHMTYIESYRGFDIELAWHIASALDCKPEIVDTTWDTLVQDAKADAFDMAIGGISRTPQREAELTLSDDYLETGKTILCRKADAARFTSLADIDEPDVRVMYNPGGTNESFVKANLHHADCRIFAKNVDIPHQIVLGKADVMITETVEAAFYLRRFPELAAPLIDQPFTHEAFCIAMSPKCANWVGAINHILAKLRASGKLQEMAQRCIGWPPHANHTESREENR